MGAGVPAIAHLDGHLPHGRPAAFCWWCTPLQVQRRRACKIDITCFWGVPRYKCNNFGKSSGHYVDTLADGEVGMRPSQYAFLERVEREKVREGVLMHVQHPPCRAVYDCWKMH